MHRSGSAFWKPYTTRPDGWSLGLSVSRSIVDALWAPLGNL